MDRFENLPKLIHLSHCKKMIPPGEEIQKLHIHWGYEIYFFVSGAKAFWINNQAYPLSKGDMLIIPPLAAHQLEQSHSVLYERYILHINPEFLSMLEQKMQIGMNLSLFLKQIAMEKQYLFSSTPEETDQILTSCSENFNNCNIHHGEDPTIDAITSLASSLNILALVLKKLKKQINPGYDFGNLDPIMSQALDYIDQHTQDPCRVEDLAAALYISKTTLYKKFKYFFNCSPKQYILDQKIQEAKLLLSQGVNTKITADRCGFNDYTNFIKAFTNATGISPKKYKNLKTLKI
ncbi:MAG: AraC family transcriptional regulator [Clostridia bacterium]|nr:AraC family transcriptional regulator [Clostridia bacterium]